MTGYETISALKKETGLLIKDLLAMSPTADPLFCGSPTQVAQAQWFVETWKRLGYTAGVHLKAVHYRLVSQHDRCRADGSPYENDEDSLNYLGVSSKYARYLKLIDVNAIVDHRNPDPLLYATKREGGAPEPSWGFPGSLDAQGRYRTWDGWRLPSIAASIAWDGAYTAPRIAAYGYDYESGDQPCVLEVWIEKSTMNDLLEPVCQELGVNLVPGIGFQSITSVKNMLQRVAELTDCAKPVRVFYISDFDPAGERMPVAVSRQIEFWLGDVAPGLDIKLTPIALTKEQVQRYQLPRIPIKETDHRRAKFEDAYGEGAVELDALEALHPGVLVELLRDTVAPYIDDTLEERLRDTDADADAILKDAWATVVAPHQAQLDAITADVAPIVARYQEELDRLGQGLQREIDPFQLRLWRLQAAVTDEMESLDVDLPDRPDPAIDLPDEDDWLYASDRDYLTQLAAYKALRGEVLPDIAPDDGLTKTVRELVAIFRQHDGVMNVKQYGAVVGLANSAAVAHFYKARDAGLLEQTSEGWPRQWRLRETITDETAP